MKNIESLLKCMQSTSYIQQSLAMVGICALVDKNLDSKSRAKQESFLHSLLYLKKSNTKLLKYKNFVKDLIEIKKFKDLSLEKILDYHKNNSNIIKVDIATFLCCVINILRISKTQKKFYDLFNNIILSGNSKIKL